MQAPLSEHAIGCLGKCTSGLKREDLDRITDNIHQTLEHPRGRQIFKAYLEYCDFRDFVDSLNFYEFCADVIEKHANVPASNPNLEGLIKDVERVKEMAEDLDGVPQIDLALLERYNDVVKSESRIAMLEILEDTRERLKTFLKRVHEGFKRYMSQPCPLGR